jgi:hypothetical protein
MTPWGKVRLRNDVVVKPTRIFIDTADARQESAELDASPATTGF